MTEDNKVPPEASWSNLTELQKNGVLSLILSKNPTQAAKTFRSITKRSISYFWSYVYPGIKENWKQYNITAPEEALRILRGGSISAAYELVEEIKHRDVKIRNKASNDVLSFALPRKETTGVSINDGNKEIKFIVTRG